MLEAVYESWPLLLFALIIGHAVGDFALQGEFMASYKNRHSDMPFDEGRHPWGVILTAHALIHAGLVWILTGIWYFAIAEFILHWVIDFLKSERKFSFVADQIFHVLCKVGYVAVLIYTAGWF